jgi:DNA-directed RNA polymerase specialized sigma54-like protein
MSLTWKLKDPKTVKDMIIKEQEAEIQALSDNLERAKWIIKYSRARKQTIE